MHAGKMPKRETWRFSPKYFHARETLRPLPSTSYSASQSLWVTPMHAQHESSLTPRLGASTALTMHVHARAASACILPTAVHKTREAPTCVSGLGNTRADQRQSWSPSVRVPLGGTCGKPLGSWTQTFLPGPSLVPKNPARRRHFGKHKGFL
jgi:hypothetical protein